LARARWEEVVEGDAVDDEVGVEFGGKLDYGIFDIHALHAADAEVKNFDVVSFRKHIFQDVGIGLGFVHAVAVGEGVADHHDAEQVFIFGGEGCYAAHGPFIVDVEDAVPVVGGEGIFYFDFPFFPLVGDGQGLGGVFFGFELVVEEESQFDEAGADHEGGEAENEICEKLEFGLFFVFEGDDGDDFADGQQAENKGYGE